MAGEKLTTFYTDSRYNLSDAEIARLIPAMRNGDREARDKLVMYAQRIFFRKARWKCSRSDREDVVSDANVLLLEKIADCADIESFKKRIYISFEGAYLENYRQGTCSGFAGFSSRAKTCCELRKVIADLDKTSDNLSEDDIRKIMSKMNIKKPQTLYGLLADMEKYFKIKSLNEPIDEDGNELYELCPGNSLTPEEELIKKRTYEMLHKSVNKLSEKERYCLLQVKVNGKRQKEIANELGVTPQSVHDTIERAVGKLRRELTPFMAA